MLEAFKKKVYEANMGLVENGLVHGTFGNVSGIDRKRSLVCIKPSGLAYEKMDPSDMVLVGLDGKTAEGKRKPSSDTPTHLVLYRSFLDIGGIVHTHSKFATAWAQAKLPISCLGTTHADHFFGDIPCTGPISDQDIAGDYEACTGLQIVGTFAALDYRHVKAVLVASHGPFCWGHDPMDAVLSAITLETVAELNLYTTALNSSLKSIKAPLLKRHYFRKHGKDAYYGQ